MHRHFTTSVFIKNSQGKILLLWHKRLQRWMPPGGHIDDNEMPEETARRECKEETGLDVEILGDAQPDLFKGAEFEGRMLKKPAAMFMANIPASEEHLDKARGRLHEPEHQHMDFFFLARPLDETQALKMAEEEADELKWFTKEEIAAIPDEKMYHNVRAYIAFGDSRLQN
jgi:ADP-ribose pyrophosphatase YjhB (NUDIX family)